jgi:hypothetical protein
MAPQFRCPNCRSCKIYRISLNDLREEDFEPLYRSIVFMWFKWSLFLMVFGYMTHFILGSSESAKSWWYIFLFASPISTLVSAVLLTLTTSIKTVHKRVLFHELLAPGPPAIRACRDCQYRWSV